MLNIVAQVSTRIFMGEELCRNEEWLNESALFAACAFNAVEVLRHWPSILRPWVAPFIAECRETRARIARCREIMEPYVTARRVAKAKALAEGVKSPVYDDSLEWFEKEYGRYDAATSQYVSLYTLSTDTDIHASSTPFPEFNHSCTSWFYHDISNENELLFRITLSIAAIHTTSDLMSEIMTQLARHPEMFQPLRQEVVEVLSRDGLKKTALYNLKLMDSVIKECQRLKPITLGRQIPNI